MEEEDCECPLCVVRAVIRTEQDPLEGVVESKFIPAKHDPMDMEGWGDWGGCALRSDSHDFDNYRVEKYLAGLPRREMLW